MWVKFEGIHTGLCVLTQYQIHTYSISDTHTHTGQLTASSIHTNTDIQDNSQYQIHAHTVSSTHTGFYTVSDKHTHHTAHSIRLPAKQNDSSTILTTC